MALTPNLGLHQWQSGDSFLRTDFNGDFGKIDAAVSKKTEVVCGSYVGNAVLNLQDNSGNTQDITLGFTPRAILVYRPSASTSNGYPNIGMAMNGKDIVAAEYSVLEIIPGGIRVGSAMKLGASYYPAFNTRGYEYYYIALA